MEQIVKDLMGNIMCFVRILLIQEEPKRMKLIYRVGKKEYKLIVNEGVKMPTIQEQNDFNKSINQTKLNVPIEDHGNGLYWIYFDDAIYEIQLNKKLPN
jgi:hypothetical protein